MSNRSDENNARNISLKTLRCCIEAYATEIEPGTAPDKRYMAAMIRNGLQIALRDFEAGRTDAYQSLIDLIDEDDIRTSIELANALRTSKITVEQQPDLLIGLINELRAELAISNPIALTNDAPY